jgi:tetratricopeptide (TPR) repeat protein
MSLYMMDSALVAQDRCGDDRLAREALAIFEDLGNLPWQASMLNQLGVHAYFNGDWVQARSAYTRAVEILERIGDRIQTALFNLNIADMLIDLGDLGEAERLARRAMRDLLASQVQPSVAQARSIIGAVMTRSGQLAEAAGVLTDAAALASSASATPIAVQAELRLAECLLLSRRPADALQALQPLLGTSVSPAIAMFVPAARRVQGCALAELGRLPEAISALDASVAAARQRNDACGIAVGLDSLIRVSQRHGLPWPPDAVAERDGLFSKLGMVQPPPIAPEDVALAPAASD